MRSAHVIVLVFQDHILQLFHQHITTQPGAYPDFRLVAHYCNVVQAHLQCIHKSSGAPAHNVHQLRGRLVLGGGWVSCLTLHVTVLASVRINGQFMSSYNMAFKATHVHLHTRVIKHSHDAAVCTRHRVHTQPSCTQSHTPWCWKLGAHTVGELVAGSRLLGLCCTHYWAHR